MKISKLFFALFASFAVVCSCSKDSDSCQLPENYLAGFGASFEAVSKATVNPDDGAVSFENGDEALVYVPSLDLTSIYRYNSSTEMFEPGTATDAIKIDDNYAYVYYPASCFSGAQSGNVTFTMPSAIAGGSAADLGDKNPMSGLLVSGSRSVIFKNLCSVLRVSLTGNADDITAGTSVSSVTLENTTLPIAMAGSYTVSWDGYTDASANVPSLSTSSTGYGMSIEPSSLVLDADSATDFFFLLPPAGNMEDMTVTVTLSDSKTYERTRSTLSVPRGKILGLSFRAGIFYDGSGTESDPWQIKTADDYKQISKLFNANPETYGGKYYKQVADIEFGATDKYAALSSYVIGNTTNKFSGKYDGNDKSLKNFRIVGTAANTGLFGYVNGLTVKNLTVENFEVSGTSQVGAIIGREDSVNGRVIGCTTVNGSVVGNAGAVAGIAGQSKGGFSRCVNEANVSCTVEGKNNVGGILGYGASALTVSECSNSGTIVGSGQATGGVVGKIDNKGGLVQNCFNTGSVSGGQAGAGGIEGVALSKIDACYNTGSVTCSAANVGGIAGSVIRGTVSRCFSKGKIKGTYAVGGLVGYLQSSSSGACLVINCAASAEVASTNTAYPGHGHSGGLVGSITSAAGYDAVLANSVAFPAKVYGLNHTGASAGAIVGRMNGAKTNTIVHNCYSQAWSGQLGNSTDNGSSVTKTTNTGGIYGYLDHGTVIDCYYTTTDGDGAEKDSGGDWQKLGNCQKISQAVRDNEGTMTFGTFAGGCAGGTLTLLQALNYGGYSSASSVGVDKTYTSSFGEETFSEWVRKSDTNYQPVPKALKDLGSKYYN